MCTIFLGVCLVMGIAVGTSSFAIDLCRVMHQTSSLGGGRLGLRGIWLREREGGEGGTGKV
jgi:hypothetical protein